jgi:predicted nucleic acid-binding protein
MKPDSFNSFIFEKIKADFFAPFFIVDEFNKYEEECLARSGLSGKEFNQRKQVVFSRINFVDLNHFKKLINTAEKFCPDENDIFYFALSLKLNAQIWSNDKTLKNQNEVEVLSTEDIIEVLF